MRSIDHLDPFTGAIFRRLLITRRTMPLSHSIFDPAEDVHRAEFHQVKFPGGYGGLIEANWKSIDRICGMRTIAASPLLLLPHFTE